MRKLYIILAFLSLIKISFSAEYHTIADGSFTDPSIWDLGVVPSNNDQIYIDHNVTLSDDLRLRGGSSLEIDENVTFIVNDLQADNFSFLIVLGDLDVNDLSTDRWSTFYVGNNGNLHASNWSNSSFNFILNGIDGTIVVDNEFHNHSGAVLLWGDGSITAGTFTGTGWTFGWTNRDIPDGSTVYSDGTLPIDLIGFEAVQDNEVVNITWSTATEINNDFFTLERSVDGTNFEEIGSVSGAGTTNEVQEYSFADLDPAQGTSYYRLKQTDYDGTSETFNMVGVEFTSAVETSTLLPKRGNLVINNMNLPYSMNIYSIDGKIAYSGESINENSTTVSLKKGFYIVTINNTSSQKVYIP